MVGFGDDCAKLVEQVRNSSVKGTFDEKQRPFDNLDSMNLDCNQKAMEKYFDLDTTQVEHKLFLLVTRLGAPGVESVIPTLSKQAATSGWDLGLILLQDQGGVNKELPIWMKSPDVHCRFFTVQPTEGRLKYDCISSLVYMLKNSEIVRIDYEHFMEILGGKGELKYENSFAPYWKQKNKSNMESCALLVQHAPDFTMSQMQRIVDTLPDEINCVISNLNNMEDGCPAIVHAWYKEKIV